MTCKQCQLQLPAFVDGSVTRDVRMAVAAHVAKCADCAGALAGERRALAHVATLLAPVSQPRRLHPAARARIAAAGRAGARPTVTWWYTWRRPLAAAAAVLALVSASSICGPSNVRTTVSPTPGVMLASASHATEQTNTLSLLVQTACTAAYSDTLAVNTVHRVSW